MCRESHLRSWGMRWELLSRRPSQESTRQEEQEGGLSLTLSSSVIDCCSDNRLWDSILVVSRLVSYSCDSFSHWLSKSISQLFSSHDLIWLLSLFLKRVIIPVSFAFHISFCREHNAREYIYFSHCFAVLTTTVDARILAHPTTGSRTPSSFSYDIELQFFFPDIIVWDFSSETHE